MIAGGGGGVAFVARALNLKNNARVNLGNTVLHT